MTAPKPSRKRGVSDAARSEIDRRIASSRQAVLDDLGRITLARSGNLNEPQVDAIGAVLSHVVGPGEDLLRVYRDWLEFHGADRALASAWADRPAGGWALAAAAMEDHVEERRDPSHKGLRALFNTDAEAEALGLTQLIPERMRSRARRRSEGVQARPDSVGAVAERPWIAEGISRATHFRRLRAAAMNRETRGEIPATRRMDPTFISIGSRESHHESHGSDPTPWIAEGVSRATFYRRQKAEHAARPDPDDLVYTLPPRGPREEKPRKFVAGTAAARRYVAAAVELGLQWQRHHSAPPGLWFDIANLPDPAARVRMIAMLAEVCDAKEAAEAQRVARDRKKHLASGPQPREPSAEEQNQPHADDPEWCPPMVDPEFWVAIPQAQRDDAMTIAGLLFLMKQFPRNQAIRIGADGARRLTRIADGIRAVLPSATADAVHDQAFGRWFRPREEAVAAGVAAIVAQSASPLDDLRPEQIAEARAWLDAQRPRPVVDDWTLTALARFLFGGGGATAHPENLIRRAQEQAGEARAALDRQHALPRGP